MAQMTKAEKKRSDKELREKATRKDRPIPRFPDKGSDPRNPTFSEWQSKEIYREDQKTSARKKHRQLNRDARKEYRKMKRRSGRR